MFALPRNLARYGYMLQQHITRTHIHTYTSADVLLSEENRQRSIACLQRTQPIGIKLQEHRSERNFAAVLILLCTSAARPNDVSILYTRRSVQLSRHMRQISFPGGIKDPTDVDFIDCALRETEEEVGLPRSRVQIWGTGSLITPPRTAAITPVVGVVTDFDLDELHINEHEVEEAFTIPIASLVDHTTLRYTQFKSGFSAPVFAVGHLKIWGVTGFITNRFLKCLIPRELNRLRRHVQFIKPYKHHHHHH